MPMIMSGRYNGAPTDFISHGLQSKQNKSVRTEPLLRTKLNCQLNGNGGGLKLPTQQPCNQLFNDFIQSLKKLTTHSNHYHLDACLIHHKFTITNNNNQIALDQLLKSNGEIV